MSTAAAAISVDSDDDDFVQPARSTPSTRRSRRRRSGCNAQESATETPSDESPLSRTTPQKKRSGKEPRSSRPTKSKRGTPSGTDSDRGQDHTTAAAVDEPTEAPSDIEISVDGTMTPSQELLQPAAAVAAAADAAAAAEEAADDPNASPTIVTRRRRGLRTKDTVNEKDGDACGDAMQINTGPQRLTAEQLQALEEALRCEICQDLFHIPMIIPACSHTFCSECIRRHLSFSDQKLRYKPQCPSCCEDAVESSLRYNRAIDEVVYRFVQVRDQLTPKVEVWGGSTARRSNGSSTPSRPMPMGGMIHFGQQLSDNGASAVVPHAEMDRSKDPAAHTLGPKRQRLPKVVYSAMNPRQLKQLLEGSHLRTTGDKRAMRKRHESLVHLYNAECDTENPRTVQECAKEVLQREDRVQQSRLVTTTQPPAFDTKDMVVLRRRKSVYLRRHREKYLILMDVAKATRKLSKVK